MINGVRSLFGQALIRDPLRDHPRFQALLEKYSKD